MKIQFLTFAITIITSLGCNVKVNDSDDKDPNWGAIVEDCEQYDVYYYPNNTHIHLEVVEKADFDSSEFNLQLFCQDADYDSSEFILRHFCQDYIDIDVDVDVEVYKAYIDAILKQVSSILIHMTFLKE